jgi:exopolysaccharide biosynthesis polyprenyl glycosylphosphotransferase
MTTFDELQRLNRAPEPRNPHYDEAPGAGVEPGLGGIVDLTDDALRPRHGPSASTSAPSTPAPATPTASAGSPAPLPAEPVAAEPVAAGPVPVVRDLAPGERGWPGRYIASLVGLDGIALLVAWSAFGVHAEASLFAVAAAATLSLPVWLMIVLACGGYDRRLLGVGRQEHRRLADALLRSAALIVVTAVLARPDATRELVIVLLPVLTATVMILRGLARGRLRRHWAVGRAVHRALLVGRPCEADAVARRLAARGGTGLRVVGTCPPVAPERPGVADPFPPPHGLAHVPAAIRAARADTVLLTSAAAADPDAVRRLAWSLEGTRVDLLLAGVPTEVAASRLAVQTIAGMPVVQLGEPGYPGGFGLLRDLADQIAAGVLLVVLSPLLACVAAAVKLCDPGPMIFKQVRVGRGGAGFTMYKFRTMHTGAEQLRQRLRAQNDHRSDHVGGVLFKMRNDPRVTGIGRLLRRMSLDELPQLVNVLRGEMSLVGPRPPLPDEVERYADDVHRRLLVKPGLTGLWQVSGRSDLKWEETVRLDLYYVENRSPALDGEILCRTARAVLMGEGAR